MDSRPVFPVLRSAMAKYDTIGINYADLRKSDGRIARRIWDALGSAETIVNVGAGAGSYEPGDRVVTAVEPSAKMIAQRPATAAPVVQASAEALPFDDQSFDAAMAILTVHHWTDAELGLRELRRVARGPVVILTYDATVKDFWLLDYLPSLATLDDRQMPPMEAYADALGPVDITAVPIPHDCTDGFLCAYWRRPAAYLDPRIRSAISSFWAVAGVEPAMERLRDDLASGAWEASYGHLMSETAQDFGYRLVVTR